MKKKLISIGICLPLCLLTGINSFAAIDYWDPEGTTDGASLGYTGSLSSTWENSLWSTNGEGSATGSAFVSADAVCFAVGASGPTPAFTVTMNSSHSIGGFFVGGNAVYPDPCTVTVTGTGTLVLGSGLLNACFVSSNSGDPGILTISNVISGSSTAGFAAEGLGQTYLMATNTYSGGSYLGYSGESFTGVWYFNNSASFGTGGIFFSNCYGELAVVGSSAITMPNGVTNIMPAAFNAYSTLNIVGNAAGVTFSGPWMLSGSSLSGSTALAGVGIASGGNANDLVTISGVISGTNGISKSGPGMLQLTAANSYGSTAGAGRTIVSNGWLVLANTSGSATGSSAIVVTSSGSTGGGTLTGNGSASGAVTINAGNISATNMSGGTATLTTGAETWLPGTTNIFAINNVAGTAGAASGWDEIVINGALTINSTWTLNVTSLTAANKQGALASFNNATNYSWPILTASGGISGFNANNVTIQTTKFANSLGGGEFALSTNGNTIYLNFLQQPTVAISPAALTVASNGTAIIQATVTGGELTYQWQLNGGSLTADASGQTTAALTISPVQDADAGTYTLTVSNPANPGGVSASLLLTVINPPQFQGPNSFTLSFAGPVGQSYRIWSTTDITLPVLSGWNLVSPGSFGPGVNTFTDTAASFTSEYYCITVP